MSDTHAALALGAEHHDAARNARDRQQALSFLLCAGRPQLLAAFADRWRGFGAAAAEEGALARQCERAAGLCGGVDW